MKKVIMFLPIFFALHAQIGFADGQSLKEADIFLEKEKFAEVLSLYEKDYKANPSDYETLWRIAYCYGKWGWGKSGESDVNTNHLRKAVLFAKKAVEVNPNGFEGHLYLAEGLGKLAKFQDAPTKVRVVREVKKEIERAIELNPQHFEPYLVLGVWHRKVAEANWLEKKLAKIFLGGLPQSLLSEAETNIKKSIQLKPDFVESHYALALVYKSMNNKKLCIEELKRTLDCPIRDKSDEWIAKDARITLKKME